MNRPDPGLEDQATWRTYLRVGGWAALGAGFVLTAVAMIDFFGAFGSFEPPRNFWMGFVGLPLIAIGSAMLKAGYLGPASRYVAGEVTPTLRDTLGAIGIGGEVSCCPACGGRNDADARFCDDCGTPLRRTCPACNTENAGDASFCDSCGAVLTG